MTMPARPPFLAVGRSLLGGVCAGLPIREETVEDLKLALSEACGNAIEHGYGGERGTLEIAVRSDGCEIEISVADHGTGFTPAPAGEREHHLGIGLSMIGALSDRWRAESAPGSGTVVTFAHPLDG